MYTKLNLIQATIDFIMEHGLEKLTINKVIKKEESSKGPLLLLLFKY
ncbi:hypothetical protein SAMN05192559_104128 [Halobacillus karajensis]|uniref:Uncharacterized protein n=1 Tax=Halobacillus karajensis TaxID=195088 RepID=A0A024P1S3_9BACI|nr:hypothetical protein BN982_01947 [Halobacillus karajensis]CDQ22105.1 hypothetical protein BN983_00308 [Halobacillus karajensis]CDQ27946.1 hypothetical protein BN981_02235 [Halobacillus karajensis]SEH78958.1 hypothetical protein SAMN05192559_104128 [Halobacillus karajensis]